METVFANAKLNGKNGCKTENVGYLHYLLFVQRLQNPPLFFFFFFLKRGWGVVIKDCLINT